MSNFYEKSDIRNTELMADFQVGTVVSLIFDTLFKNFLKIAGFSLLAFLPFFGLIFIAVGAASTGGGADTGGAATGGASTVYTAGYLLGFFATIFLTLFAYILTQVGVTYLTIEHHAGHSVSFGEMVKRSLRYVIPAIVSGILVGLMVWLGLLLLVIPGLFFFTATYVAIPSMISEKKGIIACIDRSFALTKGYRWPIFGILIIIVVIYYVILLILTLVGQSGLPFVETVVDILSVILSISFFSVASATIYTSLRTAKEGVDTEEIAKVFA